MSQIKAGPMKTFGSSKTYNHSVGLSCAFRQWRAKSHCRFLHGYAIKVRVEFSAVDLDENNWAVDFGGLKDLKAYLEEMFDHKTLVASDDPLISTFRELAQAGMIQLAVVPSIGIEAFSKMVFDYVQQHIIPRYPHVTLEKVEVSEHEGNSAWYGRQHLSVDHVANLVKSALRDERESGSHSDGGSSGSRGVGASNAGSGGPAGGGTSFGGTTHTSHHVGGGGATDAPLDPLDRYDPADLIQYACGKLRKRLGIVGTISIDNYPSGKPAGKDSGR